MAIFIIIGSAVYAASVQNREKSSMESFCDKYIEANGIESDFSFYGMSDSSSENGSFSVYCNVYGWERWD